MKQINPDPTARQPGAKDMTAVQPLFFDLRQVATMLGINYCTAWDLVNTGRISAMQIGRRWKVTQASIDAFIERGTAAAQQKAQRNQQLRDHIGGATTWPSANAARPGGSTSRRQVDNELDSRLRQLTARRPRSCTTD
jgi:excisionase family DNA binding protein